VVDDEYVSGVPATVNSVRSRDILIENNFIIGNTHIPTQTVRGKILPCIYKTPGTSADLDCTGIFGIFLYGVGQAIVRGNEIHNTTLSAIRPDLVKNSLIEDNTLDMSVLAIWAHAHGEFDLSDNIFRGNTISHSYVAIGIGQNGLRNIVEDNVVFETDSGIRIYSSQENPEFGRIYRHPPQATIIRGNRVYNSSWGGIAIMSWRPADPVNILSAKIYDNEVYQNGAAEGPFEGLVNAGILIFYSGPAQIVIRKNRIFDNQVNGIILTNLAFTPQPDGDLVPVSPDAQVEMEISGNTISNNGWWGVTALVAGCMPEWPEEWSGITDESFSWEVVLSGNEIEGHEFGEVCLPAQLEGGQQ